MKKLILASASPRRKELLARCGLPFEVDASEVDETVHTEDGAQMVRCLAQRKAKAVFDQHPDAIVIGSDTVVTCRGQIFGKPKDEADAVRMLELLQGETHVIYTGLCIMDDVRTELTVSKGQLHFAPMSTEEIKAYVATGEPMGKAGAYAVQGIGGRYIESIEGDWYAIVGLPLRKTYETIQLFLNDE